MRLPCVPPVHNRLRPAAGQLRYERAETGGNHGEYDAERRFRSLVLGTVGTDALRPTLFFHTISNALPSTSPANVGTTDLKILSPNESGSFSLWSRIAFTFSSTVCRAATTRSALDSIFGISLMKPV